MQKGWIAIALTHAHYPANVGVTVHEVTVLDAENRIVKYESGTVRQIDSMDEVYETPDGAMLAGAARMQEKAEVLYAAANEAKHEAARLAAAGRVTVCST